MLTKLSQDLFYEEDCKWPFPGQASIQLPCFPQDRQCSSQRFFDILIFFVQSLGTLPWEITKYLIDNEHSDPIRMICMQAYRLLKKAARPGTWFLVAPTSISSWFLCPCPPLLLCTPTQKPPCYAGYFQVKSKLCNMLGNI